MSDKTDSEQIDEIIAQQTGWKKDALIALRAAIKAADPDAVEVVKYKKPSKPEGVRFGRTRETFASSMCSRTQ